MFHMYFLSGKTHFQSFTFSPVCECLTK